MTRLDVGPTPSCPLTQRLEAYEQTAALYDVGVRCRRAVAEAPTLAAAGNAVNAIVAELHAAVMRALVQR